ncbi:MAG: O-antigen ligase family protein [Candidatus Competibacteraceae bacterium]|nr:O-antigen ligase family protein [Candidatus Competibacteraceae bacterium]
MKLTPFHYKIQEAFFRQGWLLPAVLPLTQIGGRALFNVVAGSYALWGLLSLWSRRKQLDRMTALLYLLLLSVFLLGIPGAVEPAGALRTWGMFLMQSLTLLLMQAALQESSTQLDRLLNVMALLGGITLAGLYVLLPYYVLGGSGQPFDPSTQLQEDNLPFLLPFMLGWIWRQQPGRWCYGAMIAVIAASLGYVVLAEGRAALLGLCVGLAVFCWTVLGWRLRWIALLMILVLAIGIVANTGPFRKAEMDPEHPLDAFTTGRTILWRQALAHPPARPWLGVGIGNGFRATQVLNFEIDNSQIQVKHLHNFLMDAWYETGLLGLGALLALMGTVLGRLAWVWRRLSAADRQRAGVLLAAALAIMTAGLLSFSYTSRYFACYLFACLGGLSYCATLPAAADTIPDRR